MTMTVPWFLCIAFTLVGIWGLVALGYYIQERRKTFSLTPEQAGCILYAMFTATYGPSHVEADDFYTFGDYFEATRELVRWGGQQKTMHDLFLDIASIAQRDQSYQRRLDMLVKTVNGLRQGVTYAAH